MRFNIAYLKGGEDFFGFVEQTDIPNESIIVRKSARSMKPEAIELLIHELAHNLKIKGAITSHEPKEYAQECCRIGAEISYHYLNIINGG